MKSIFVTLEGVEGSGKSTLMKNLFTYFSQKNVRVFTSREPGGSALAEKIRTLLLENSMSAITELLLLQAARHDHITQTLLPALKTHDLVLCDRFIDSTFAYQGTARGLDLNWIDDLNHRITKDAVPDLTFFLQCSPNVGLNRAKNPNRFEHEGVVFQKKVEQGLLLAEKRNPKRTWVYLNSEHKNAEELTQKAAFSIEALFQKKEVLCKQEVT
jgi:dTMP kinase